MDTGEDELLLEAFRLYSSFIGPAVRPTRQVGYGEWLGTRTLTHGREDTKSMTEQTLMWTLSTVALMLMLHSPSMLHTIHLQSYCEPSFRLEEIECSNCRGCSMHSAKQDCFWHAYVHQYLFLEYVQIVVLCCSITVWVCQLVHPLTRPRVIGQLNYCCLYEALWMISSLLVFNPSKALHSLWTRSSKAKTISDARCEAPPSCALYVHLPVAEFCELWGAAGPKLPWNIILDI